MSDEAVQTAVGIREVTKRFGDVTAVNHVDIDVDDGEFFSLLGPSGCGKTTMLRIIAGLDLPTSGSVTIFGDEVADTPPNRRPVNTVFQHYALFPHMDVSENVSFGLRMQKVAKAERRQRASAALSLVRLDGLERRRPAELSGGQQQRVALARALVNQPKVLLLDEPLGALDLQLRQEMQLELKALQRELGITFVFVTHDQEEALTMSDRIAVMDHGRVLQVGRPHEIYEHPNDRFVAGFIGRTNLLDATVSGPREIALANGARLATRPDGSGVGRKVTAALRPEHISIRRLDDATPHGGIPEPTAVGSSLTGVVTSVTYLGNAVVHRVTVDWIPVDVRTENEPGAQIPEGADVEISWDSDALTVFHDAEPAPERAEADAS